MSNARPFLSYYPNRVAAQYDYAQHARDWQHEVAQRRQGSPFYSSPVKFWFRDKDHRSLSGSQELPLPQRVAQEQRFSDFGQWVEWQKAGKNIFSFSPGLVEMLSHTDVAGIAVQDIKLPLPVIYLDLSGSDIAFMPGSPARVEGVYISEFDDTEDNSVDCKIERGITFRFVGDYVGLFSDVMNLLVQGEEINCYTLYSNEYSTGERWTVDKACSEQVKALWFAEDLTEENRAQHAEIIELYQGFMQRTIKLAVNCLLYLMLPEREVEQGEVRPELPEALQKKLRKATTKARLKAVEADIKGLGFTRVHYVGNSIIRRAERGEAGSGNVLPHWRRGHWRNQRVGAGLIEERLTWIKPVVVNKQLGEPVKGRVYEV